MGFGELSAVEILREAGIVVGSTPGLRTGLIIVDGEGYIFTPPRSILRPTNVRPAHPTHCAYPATR
ncbi:MAG: hypothetical protein WAN75_27560 [Xanthobacteraceae bacterium]